MIGRFVKYRTDTGRWELAYIIAALPTGTMTIRMIRGATLVGNTITGVALGERCRIAYPKPKESTEPCQ